MKKTEWTDEEVYELLCKIDQGYAPDADEAAMLAARTALDLQFGLITSLPESIGRLKSLQTLDLSYTQIIALPDSIGQLTSLQALNLRSTQITTLPESIGQLTCLQTLNLEITQITALPESIGQLTNLQELKLWKTEITALPSSVGQLISLKTLDLLSTKITALPESIGQLTSLQTLDLGRSQITALPESIGRLINLTRLNLTCSPISYLPETVGTLAELLELAVGGTKMKKLPDSLSGLKQLQRLWFWGEQVSTIPEWIWQLANLQTIDLSRTPITALPDSIGQLASLQELNLSGTPITTLPESIGQLTSLQGLNLSGTPITTLPDSIGRLTSLQKLDLNNTPITALPDSIGYLTNLQTLSLGGTPIIALPESISQLTNLQKLDLRETKFTALPSYILKFKKLQQLMLGSSKITELPEQIGELSELTRLGLEELTIPALPKSLALRRLPFFEKETFSDPDRGVNLYKTILTEQDISVFLETPELIPSLYEDQVLLRECRVLFLGDGGSGKTYTIRRIRNDCKKEGDGGSYLTVQTPGVEIADYHVDRGEDSFDIHFWDFGGQELQHSMHRCFLTDKTCYVVTVRTREADVTPRARFWLQNVTAFAPTSPILLYVNCWENYDGRKTIDEAMLREEFPNIRKVVYVSAKEAEEEAFRKELVDKIADMAADSYGCRQTVNRRWLAVQKDILAERRTSHWLTKADYTALCRKHGIPEDQDAALLELFNILGVCFSYHWDEDRNELEDYKLLNPVWLTNAIYTIIVRGEDHAQEGEITVRSIRDLLNRQEAEQAPSGQPARPKRAYGTRECQYVVDVAAAHNLCYRVNERSLFFPALCSNNTPVQELSNSGDYAQHIEYLLQYTFLPDSVVHQLMVRCRKADVTVNHCWLRGMVLGCMDAHKAIIRMEDDKNLSIRIWSKADHPAYEFFELIRRELLAVNKNLNRRAKELIVEGRSQLPVEDLLPAARDKAYVYCGGKKVLAEKLLGQFYENWTIQFMRVEENGYIKVPILPSKFHACSKDNQNLRKALYKAYNGYCQYCGKPIPDIHDMQVEHILPKEYVEQPELTEYVSYLKQRGFAVEKPDFVENYLPAHGKCNRDKSDFVSPFALLARHDLAARRAPTVLRLIDEYKKANKE